MDAFRHPSEGKISSRKRRTDVDSIGKTGSPGDVSIMGPTPVLQKKKGREKDEWPRYQVTLAPASRTSHVRNNSPDYFPTPG